MKRLCKNIRISTRCIVESLVTQAEMVMPQISKLFQPPLAPKVKIDPQTYQEHQNQHPWITPSLLEFRHEFEVHPVDTHDESKRHEEDRENGEDFHYVIGSLRLVSHVRVHQVIDIIKNLRVKCLDL